MKPTKHKAEVERLAKVRLRKYARRIKDNAHLSNIMARFEGPFRVDFYYKVRPYLKFTPAPLEVLDGIRSN